MEIIRANVLTDEELLAANELIKAVQAFDQTHRTPYLSNQLNFDADMPSFFLCYDEGKLVALLTVYADCQEAELAILVHPNIVERGMKRRSVVNLMRLDVIIN